MNRLKEPLVRFPLAFAVGNLVLISNKDNEQIIGERVGQGGLELHSWLIDKYFAEGKT